ncbi:MAG: hypothetical protein ABI026_01040, partial [Gemmatimonadaceae bacterium]
RYGAPFLIGEQTFRSLPASSGLSVRAVDRVAAKGKTQALTLYEVLDAETDDRRRAKEATRSLLDGAMTCYFARDFTGATALLADARDIDVKDPVLAIIADRCAGYAVTAPPDQWSGAESLDFK